MMNMGLLVFWVLNVGLLAGGIWVLYWVIKTAVKKGVMEAFREMKKGEKE